MIDNGHFVTVEGVDGSGTTTVSTALATRMDNGLLTQEPTDGWTGQYVREAISRGGIDNAFVDFFLFLADRAYHVEDCIIPAVRSGNFVVSDRYADSTRAYQTISLSNAGIPSDHVSSYIEQAMGPILFKPDITLWLDANIDTTFSRLEKSEKFEEEISFQRQVHDQYRVLYETTDRIHRIDANQKIHQVIADSIRVVEEKLNM